MKRLLLALALAFAWPQMTLAEDTVYAGQGADIVPVSDADVRLVDEHVVLEAQGHNAGWKVLSVFHLRNDALTAQTVQIGFPYVNHQKAGHTKTIVPPGRELNPALIYDFAVTVRGVPIKVEDKALDKAKAKGSNDVFDNAYVWAVEFKPGETIEVVASYITGMSQRVDGCLFAHYLLKTGGEWKGGYVGQTKIEIIPHRRFMLCNAIEELASIISLPSPDGMKIMGKGNDQKLVWELRNHQPTSDLSVCFLPVDDYAAFRRQWGYPTKEMLEQMDDMELRIRRNQYYARFGYSFHTPLMKKYFESQPWYQANPSYTVRDIPAEDLKQIKAIKVIETLRQHKKAIQRK